MRTFIIGCLLLASMVALAQDDFYKKEQPKPAQRQYVITLQDGSQLRGELIRQDSVEAVIKTSNLGQVTIKASQIVSMIIVGSTESTATDGYPNLFPQYMSTAPTAYQAERGKLYYRNVYLAFSQFEYGITNNWSVGATFFTFDPTLLASFKTKVSFPVGNTLRLGVQGQIGTGRDLFDIDGGLTYLQGIASVGTPQHNVTLGVGVLRVFSEFSSDQLLTVGTVQKVSPSLTFIGEVSAVIGDFNDAGTFVLAGIRFDRKRHSFDLSAATVIPARGGFPILPYLAYQLRISK